MLLQNNLQLEHGENYSMDIEKTDPIRDNINTTCTTHTHAQLMLSCLPIKPIRYLVELFLG